MVFSAEHVLLQILAAVVAAFLLRVVGVSRNLPSLTLIVIVLMFVAETFMIFKYDTGLYQYAVTCVREDCPRPVSERSATEPTAPTPIEQQSPNELSAAKAPEQFGFIDIFRAAPDRLNRDTAEISFTANGEWLKDNRQVVIQGGAYAIFASNDGQSWGSVRSAKDATISGLTYERIEGVLPPFLYLCTASPMQGEDRLLIVEETLQLTSDASAYVLVRPRSYRFASTVEQCFSRSLTRYVPPERPNPVGQEHQGKNLIDTVIPVEFTGNLQARRTSGGGGFGPRFGPVALGGQLSVAITRLKEMWPDMQTEDIAVHGLPTKAVAVRRPSSSQLLVLFGRKDVDEIAGYSLITNTFPETPTFVDLRERVSETFGPPLHVGGFGGGTQGAAWSSGQSDGCAKSGQRVTWSQAQSFETQAHPYLHLRRDWPGTDADACNIYISLVAVDTPHVSQFDLTVANTRHLTPP